MLCDGRIKFKDRNRALTMSVNVFYHHFFNYSTSGKSLLADNCVEVFQYA